MKQLFIFLILTFFITQKAVYSQFSVYNFVPDSYKDTLLFDDFEQRKDNFWSQGTANKSAGRFENGFYYWQSLYENPRTTYHAVNIYKEEDFEVEGSFRFLGNTPNGANALMIDNVFGGAFYLGFTGYGEYVGFHQKDSLRNFLPYTQSNLIDTIGYNKLTIRRVQSQYYFFINQVLVYSEMQLFSAPVNQVGFTVAPNSTIEIEWIKVFKLKKLYELPSTLFRDETIYAGLEMYNKTETETDFDSQISGWQTGTMDMLKANILDGQYYLTSLNDSIQYIYNVIDIEHDRDFEIETSFKYIEGLDNSEMAFIWDANADTSHRFGIIPKGFMRYICTDSIVNNIIAIQKTPLINSNEYNTVTIRKIGETQYLFLNQKLLLINRYKTLQSNRIGFQIPPNTTICVDYIKLSYFDFVQTKDR